MDINVVLGFQSTRNVSFIVRLSNHNNMDPTVHMAELSKIKKSKDRKAQPELKKNKTKKTTAARVKQFT